MNYYQEITLLTQNEIGLYFLWEKVYQQIHLRLVEQQDDTGQVPIGLAFPEYKSKYLGSKLRLLAKTAEALEAFNANLALARLSDYVHMTGIRPILSDKIIAYACYPRLQVKSNVCRLARRRAKRLNISLEQAEADLQHVKEQTLINVPYVWIKSHSNGERFRLFIGYKPMEGSVGSGFGTYGLSRQTSIPIF